MVSPLNCQGGVAPNAEISMLDIPNRLLAGAALPGSLSRDRNDRYTRISATWY